MNKRIMFIKFLKKGGKWHNLVSHRSIRKKFSNFLTVVTLMTFLFIIFSLKYLYDMMIFKNLFKRGQKLDMSEFREPSEKVHVHILKYNKIVQKY